MPPTVTPSTIWERGGARPMPEPAAPRPAGLPVEMPKATRQLVVRRLQDLSGVQQFRDDDRLANEIGLDSLARGDLALWLESEFGCSPLAPEALRTVGDVLLAAAGEVVSGGPADVPPAPLAP